jgi:hypothetical protein
LSNQKSCTINLVVTPNHCLTATISIQGTSVPLAIDVDIASDFSALSNNNIDEDDLGEYFEEEESETTHTVNHEDGLGEYFEEEESETTHTVNHEDDLGEYFEEEESETTHTVTK